MVLVVVVVVVLNHEVVQVSTYHVSLQAVEYRTSSSNVIQHSYRSTLRKVCLCVVRLSASIILSAKGYYLGIWYFGVQSLLFLLVLWSQNYTCPTP